MNDRTGKFLVMVMGLPLEPARQFAQEVFRASKRGLPFVLYSRSLTGPYVLQQSAFICERKTAISFFKHYVMESELTKFLRAGQKCKGAVIVDFSDSSRIESNLTNYCYRKQKIPSVIVTPSEHKNRIKEIVDDSGGCTVTVSEELQLAEEIFKAIKFIVKNFQTGRIYSMKEVVNGNKKL